VSQTYEFRLEDDLAPGAYPISLRLFGYQRFDGASIAVANPQASIQTTAQPPVELRDDGEFFDALFPFRRRGLDILRRRRPGIEEALVDRAAEAWIDRVRELTEGTHPEFALHFTIPDPGRSRPRHDGQGQRLTELVPRLNFFLRDLKPLWITHASYSAGERTLNPRDRLNGQIENDRLNFHVDEATMGGDPAPGEEKLLILGWAQDGLELDRSFDGGTHVGLPDPNPPSNEATSS
jgi:hypothetical protein